MWKALKTSSLFRVLCLTARPLSHISNASSGRNSPVFKPPAAPEEDPYVPPDDDPIVLQTTSVVKAIMELSNKVPLSRPNQYVELVKVSWLPLILDWCKQSLCFWHGCVLALRFSRQPLFSEAMIWANFCAQHSYLIHVVVLLIFCDYGIYHLCCLLTECWHDIERTAWESWWRNEEFASTEPPRGNIFKPLFIAFSTV